MASGPGWTEIETAGQPTLVVVDAGTPGPPGADGSGGGSGSPGGATTNVQYNDAGDFGGNSGFVYNKSTHAVTITGAFQASNFASGASVSGTNTGDQTTITGNAATATALQNARTINGTSFDGTANIVVTAAAGSLTGSSLNSSVTGSSLTGVGTIVSGTWNGTVVAVLYGGTGATSASGARTNLGLVIGTDVQAFNATTLKHIFGITIDGGGSAPSTGVKGYFRVPYAGTITKVTLLGDVTGSAVIDVWKVAFASYPPTVTNTITASAKPTLSSAKSYEDATLTGWTTAITAGDVFGFNLDSVTTCTRLTLEIEYTRS